MTQELSVLTALPEQIRDIAVTWTTRGLDLNTAKNKAYDIVDLCESFPLPVVTDLTTLSEQELDTRLKLIPTIRENIKTMRGYLTQVNEIMAPSIEVMTGVVDKLREPAKELFTERTHLGKKVREGIIADHEAALLILEKKATDLAEIKRQQEILLQNHRMDVAARYNQAISNMQKDIAFEINSAYTNAIKTIAVKDIQNHIAFLIGRHIWGIAPAPKFPTLDLQEIADLQWAKFDCVAANAQFATDLRAKFSDFATDKANAELALKKAAESLVTESFKIEQTAAGNLFAAQMQIQSVPVNTPQTKPGTKDVYKLKETNHTPESLQALITAVFANKQACFATNKTYIATIEAPFITMLENAMNAGTLANKPAAETGLVFLTDTKLKR